MAILSKQQLKELWVTGYTPTQTDYANLFDTMISYVKGNLTSNYKFISGGISTGAIDTNAFGILWYDSISTCDFLFIISGAENTNASEGPRFLLYQGEDIGPESSLSKDETKTSKEIINIFVYGNPEGTGDPKDPVWQFADSSTVDIERKALWDNPAKSTNPTTQNLTAVISSILFALGLRGESHSPFRLVNGQQGDTNLFGIIWIDNVNSGQNAVLFSAYGNEIPCIALYQFEGDTLIGRDNEDDSLVQAIYNEQYGWCKIWGISSETKTVQALQYTLQDEGSTETVYVSATPGSVTELYSVTQRVHFTVKFLPQTISKIDWKDMSYQPAMIITPGYATVTFDEQSDTAGISKIFYDADSPSEELMNHRTDTVNGASGYERRVYTIRAIKDGNTEKCNLFISWKYYADGFYSYPPLE